MANMLKRRQTKLSSFRWEKAIPMGTKNQKHFPHLTQTNMVIEQIGAQLIHIASPCFLLNLNARNYSMPGIFQRALHSLPHLIH